MPKEWKTCPFCGAKDPTEFAHEVQCWRCMAKANKFQWNTRAPSPEAEALARAVERGFSIKPMCLCSFRTKPGKCWFCDAREALRAYRAKNPKE